MGDLTTNKKVSVSPECFFLGQVCLIALSVLGRPIDSAGTVADAARNFLCDLASLVYVDPEITDYIQKVKRSSFPRSMFYNLC